MRTRSLPLLAACGAAVAAASPAAAAAPDRAGLPAVVAVYGTAGKGAWFDDGSLRKATGLPADAYVARFWRCGPVLFAGTRHHGLYASHDDGRTWSARTNGLGRNLEGIRELAALAADPVTGYAVAATKHRLYQSTNLGLSWTALAKPPTTWFNTFQGLALSGPAGARPDRLLLPTAFNGLLSAALAGGRPYWRYASTGLPGWARERNSYQNESVADAARGPDGKFYAAMAFGAGLYESADGFWWKKLENELPAEADDDEITGLVTRGDRLLVETPRSLFAWIPAAGKIVPVAFGAALARGPKLPIACLAAGRGDDAIVKRWRYPVNRDGARYAPEAYDRLRRQKLAADKRGIFLMAWFANKANLPAFLDLIDKSTVNAVVVDMKDDFGRVCYDSKLPHVKAAGAVWPAVNVTNFVHELRKRGLWSIARIVVFKDPKLWAYQGGKYAIHDLRSGKPWVGGAGAGDEHWVDPSAPFVADYNAAIANELAALGFDEIQFDYIRFPTDGPVWNCKYPWQVMDLEKSEVIAEFLRRVRREVRVPVSVDIYGDNGWSVVADRQGQDIELIREHVDAVCPMFYPSHFGELFLNLDPYRVLKEGTRRAIRMTGSAALIRPWLQAFGFRAPNYGPGYITAQVKGTLESGGSGYLFWNMGGTYGPVWGALKK